MNLCPENISKFWSNVGKTPTCWLWRGFVLKSAKGAAGYGAFNSAEKNGKMIRAHRFSYELHKGPIGDQMVCHQCDVTICVNPDHLELGDALRNGHDKVVRGRASRYGARLKDTEAKSVREQFAAGSSIGDLARRYGVSHTTMNKIVHGKSYRHLLGMVVGHSRSTPYISPSGQQRR